MLNAFAYLLKQPYERLVRPYLPQTIAVNNGVAIRSGHLFDAVLPWHTSHVPGYEARLVDAIREHVRPGDEVVVVGGGWGVSTVVAAHGTGDDGAVTVFEASAVQFGRLLDTLALNEVAHRVSPRHALVATSDDVYGTTGDAMAVEPTDLPPCDVLVLDCEGAEGPILEGLDHEPRVVIVETHGMYDSPPSRVAGLLSDRGYDIDDRGAVDPSKREFCERNGIHVLIGVRE